MQIYEYPWKMRPEGLGKCALALGFFDGLHAAHRKLILRAKREAALRGVPLGIFTFKSSGDIKQGAERIYGEDERTRMISELGADFMIVSDFSRIKDVTAENFVKENLVEDIGCICCVAGFNFKFGKGALGNADSLVRLMRECGHDAVIYEELRHGDTTVSASEIRTLIKRGDVKRADELLGAPYFLRGVVSHGNGEGTGLGFPTVNIDFKDGALVPKTGVYRSATLIDGKIYSALTNVGTCPTFKSRRVHSETYIIDFSGDLYGRELCIYLLDYLREERTFASADGLTAQINKDKERILKENGDLTWQELGLS